MTLLRATAGPPLSAAEQPGRRGHCAVSSSHCAVSSSHCAVSSSCSVHCRWCGQTGPPVCVQSAVPLAGDVVMISILVSNVRQSSCLNTLHSPVGGERASGLPRALHTLSSKSLGFALLAALFKLEANFFPGSPWALVSHKTTKRGDVIKRILLPYITPLSSKLNWDCMAS